MLAAKVSFEVIEAALSLGYLPDELILLDIDCRPTGTNESTVRLYPTKRLRSFAAAFAARNADGR